MGLSEKMQDRVSYHTKRSFELLDEADKNYKNPQAAISPQWPLSIAVQLAQAHMQMLLLLKEMEE